MYSLSSTAANSSNQNNDKSLAETTKIITNMGHLRQHEQDHHSSKRLKNLSPNRSKSSSSSSSSAIVVTKAVGMVAQRRVNKMKGWSMLRRHKDPTSPVKECSINDFHFAQMLGEGSFGEVYQVHMKKGNSNNETQTKANNTYALKCLNRKMLLAATTPSDTSAAVSKDHFRKMVAAYIDLATEAHILSHLNHENIVKIHGVVAESGTSSQYFFVMDVLHETLRERLIRWKASMDSKITNNSKETMLSRIESAALGIVNAMEYLHIKNIVFHDLKPENVGFDRHDRGEEENGKYGGTIKLFDFGLAREVHMIDHDKTVGSLPYIAPECCYYTGVTGEGGASCDTRKSRDTRSLASGSKEYFDVDASINSLMSQQSASSSYSQSGIHSDVYSFGFVLWEICTLESAFETYKRETRKCKHMSELLKWRPSTTKPNETKKKGGSQSMIPSHKMESLITNCWDANPKYRPTFKYIRQSLEDKLMKKKKQKKNKSQHGKRTSLTTTFGRRFSSITRPSLGIVVANDNASSSRSRRNLMMATQSR